MEEVESAAIVQPRGFESATRLELTAGPTPSDKRKQLVEEIKKLVDEVNDILMRRDGLYRTPRKFRKKRFNALAEEYAERMVKIEEKHKELLSMEKEMKILSPEDVR